jgi:hypothetical protein
MERESVYSEKEEERKPKRKVLKISEMALYLDGEYVGEIGNPSYGEKKDMFIYDPEDGLVVDGEKSTELLEVNNFVRLSHDLGHITIDRLLGEEPRKLSDREFEIELCKIYRNIKNKIEKIVFITNALGSKYDGMRGDMAGSNLDWDIKSIAGKNVQFSPEELFETIIETLRDKYSKQNQDNEEKMSEFDKTIEGLRKMGALDVNVIKNRNSIVDYFYLYCRLRNINSSDVDAIYDKGFNDFIFLDELMKEYERQGDIRFGDALLIACSRQKRDWDREQNIQEE